MTRAEDGGRRAEGAELRLTGLSHSYGALEAIRDVTLEVRPGTVCSVLGPNGAGKSTLASAVAGVIPTDAGSVVVDGDRRQRGAPLPAGPAGGRPRP